MGKNAHRTSRMLSLLFLGLAANFAGTGPTLAADAKDKQKDAAAEETEAAKEDADEAAITDMAEQLRKYQHEFHGTFLLPSDPSQKTSAAVVGTFVTDEKDRNPNQTYLVKADKGKEDIVKALTRFDGKKVAVQGKLRNSGKYLIVSLVVEPAPGPPRTDRRGQGGI